MFFLLGLFFGSLVGLCCVTRAVFCVLWPSISITRADLLPPAIFSLRLLPGLLVCVPFADFHAKLFHIAHNPAPPLPVCWLHSPVSRIFLSRCLFAFGVWCCVVESVQVVVSRDSLKKDTHNTHIYTHTPRPSCCVKLPGGHIT